jgi:hypothetical protein
MCWNGPLCTSRLLYSQRKCRVPGNPIRFIYRATGNLLRFSICGSNTFMRRLGRFKRPGGNRWAIFRRNWTIQRVCVPDKHFWKSFNIKTGDLRATTLRICYKEAHRHEKEFQRVSVWTSKYLDETWRTLTGEGIATNPSWMSLQFSRKKEAGNDHPNSFATVPVLFCNS